MKKLKYLAAIGLGLSMATSCSNSATEDFNDQHQDAAKKRLKNVSAYYSNDTSKKASTDFIYDSELKLEKVIAADGSRTSSLDYDNNGSLVNVTGNDVHENLNLEELYQSPYKAFKEGTVLEYDTNKNPSKIIFHQKEYEYQNGTYTQVIKDYTAEVSYDNAPNLFFYTLEAAGIIDVLDLVDLNIGVNMQATEIIKARALLPMNNPSKIIYKDDLGEILETINIAYTYDASNYPTKAIITSINKQEVQKGEVSFSYYE